MASTLAVPLQLVVLGADALFAMHARLRQEVTGPDAVPVAKCDTSTLGHVGCGSLWPLRRLRVAAAIDTHVERESAWRPGTCLMHRLPCALWRRALPD